MHISQDPAISFLGMSMCTKRLVPTCLYIMSPKSPKYKTTQISINRRIGKYVVYKMKFHASSLTMDELTTCNKIGES